MPYADSVGKEAELLSHNFQVGSVGDYYTSELTSLRYLADPSYTAADTYIHTYTHTHSKMDIYSQILTISSHRKFESFVDLRVITSFVYQTLSHL